MKTIKTLYFVLAAIAALAVIGCIFFRAGQSDIVNVKSSGKIIRTIDLSAVTEPYVFVVDNGGKNTVLVERGKISVTDADCPDKLCIEQSKAGVMPIVCLPHRLVIERE